LFLLVCHIRDPTLNQVVGKMIDSLASDVEPIGDSALR